MKKQMTEKLNNNKGITLIALVITIIVMLILVAVTISMAVNGGLFEYAGNAGKETNNAIREEQQLASGKVTIDNTVYNSIDEYLEVQNGGAGNDEGEDIQGIDGEVFTALYTKTKNYTDKNGDTAVIPKGFSVGKSEGINTIDEGLVIQDAKGNQFVWIPVEYTETGILDKNKLDSGFKEVFKRNLTTIVEYEDAADYFLEPHEYGYEGEVAEYYEMMLSVQENKGFYIGRFEAGTEEPRDKEVANGTDELVIKRDVYPYNYVAWGKSTDNYMDEVVCNVYDWEDFDDDGNPKLVGSYNQGHGAVYLSKHLLDGQTTDATSTLCYGVQWDAMLKFMGKDEEEDSTEWGNYINNDFTITRPAAKYGAYEYNDDMGIDDFQGWTTTDPEWYKILTTGASDEFKLKNIFDVAGNVREWTMEQYVYVDPEYEVFDRILRGGASCSYGGYENCSYRSYGTPSSASLFNCFRTALYITNK